ncbi:MAG: hypothetical protein SNJ29_09465 [Rikenellaceae bacterium]
MNKVGQLRCLSEDKTLHIQKPAFDAHETTNEARAEANLFGYAEQGGGRRSQTTNEARAEANLFGYAEQGGGRRSQTTTTEPTKDANKKMSDKRVMKTKPPHL